MSKFRTKTKFGNLSAANVYALTEETMLIRISFTNYGNSIRLLQHVSPPGISIK